MEERRIFERFDVDFSVKFSYADGAKQGEGRMINISAGGGGLILTSEELFPPTHLDMCLCIPDGKDPLLIGGHVVWSKRIEHNLFRAGIQFDRIDFMGISRILRVKQT